MPSDPKISLESPEKEKRVKVVPVSTNSPYLGRKKSISKSQTKDSSKVSKENGKKGKKEKYQTQPFKWSTYKFLLHYPLRHIKLTIFTNTLIIVTAILQAYLPMLIGDLLDSTT